MVAPDLPPRYAAEHRVGRGGGGEVWAVTDRITGARRALKILAADASGAELDALVREAVTLSGLEGLGVPRVLNFGRLAGDGRPYLVRELVEGDSLEALIEQRRDALRCLAALAGAAEQVTVLHRAGLLHGDIKPANIIVEPGGRATLVDLGLAAPLSERGSAPPGLTPKYAAPELLEGGSITVRSEVYALGVALEDVLDAMDSALADPLRAALGSVVERATRPVPGERYPSADEFASALRSAARLSGVSRTELGPGELWPIVGTETTARRLLEQALALPPGGTLALRGQRGSGRSVLLRRLAWALGVEGRDHLWLDASAVDRPGAVEAELAAFAAGADVTLIVDDAERLAPGSVDALAARRAAGARVVL
ncbi:MAG: serine/threonine protein kinase, partial [Deltaproteobacteria bacterium]|nr:serine/threonine protein kinase [Deltaproteobacteria bacterium]